MRLFRFLFLALPTVLLMLLMGVVMNPIHAAEPPAEPPRVPARLLKARNSLPNVFAKLKAGKTVRVAYFGGSITAAEGWRPKTLAWLRQRYPKATIEEINAAIGGTGSDLGVFRFRRDVLDKKPDLVFVEFAVNDGGADPKQIWRGMEGIVRQAWTTDPTIDLCYVYTTVAGFAGDLENGFCPRAASCDELLADQYGIPSINVGLRAAQMSKAGTLIYTPKKDEAGKELPAAPGVLVFSTDGVHPGDAGHEVYAQVVADALTQMEASARPGRHRLPRHPFIADNWEKAKLVPLDRTLVSAGWAKLDSNAGLGAQFRHRLPELWEATQPGETLTFTFKGTGARLYDILGPDGGQVVVTVDGKSGPPIARFDSFSSYHRLASLTLAENLPDAVHTVSVTLHPDQPDRRNVTDREKEKPGFDPKRYDGTAVRVGYLMLLGDLVRR